MNGKVGWLSRTMLWRTSDTPWSSWVPNMAHYSPIGYLSTISNKQESRDSALCMGSAYMSHKSQLHQMLCKPLIPPVTNLSLFLFKCPNIDQHSPSWSKYSIQFFKGFAPSLSWSKMMNDANWNYSIKATFPKRKALVITGYNIVTSLHCNLCKFYTAIWSNHKGIWCKTQVLPCSTPWNRMKDCINIKSLERGKWFFCQLLIDCKINFQRARRGG